MGGGTATHQQSPQGSPEVNVAHVQPSTDGGEIEEHLGPGLLGSVSQETLEEEVDIPEPDEAEVSYRTAATFCYCSTASAAVPCYWLSICTW